jgi:hypothetical protein
MDTGAQQDAPNTNANTSGAGTAEDTGAGNNSAEIDKGKAPEKPKTQAQVEPEKTAPKHDMPAPPEKSAPAPAKTGAPAKTPVPTRAKATPTPPSQAKSTSTKMTKIIKEKSVIPSASMAMTLHTSKGAARVSSFNTPELDGRAPLQTKSGNSLGSLKEYCLSWNAADIMDTASSGKQKAPARTQALIAGNPPEIPAKPRAIANATTISF